MRHQPAGRSSLDPRAPFVLDTRELGRRPGSMRELVVTAPAPPDLGVPLVAVTPGAPVQLDLRLESVMEGVLVTGTVTAPLTGECARCLEPFTDEIEVDLQELYVYPERTDRAGHSGAPDDDDEGVRSLDGDLLDLEPAVRDAVVLALPLTPVCSPDCQGLDLHGRPRTATDGGSDEPVDPRWTALVELRDAGDGAR